jgi:hypothetical protein
MVTKEDNITGTPTMALLPSKKYLFKMVTDKSIKVTIPRKGSYYELNKDVYSKKDGEFHIYDEENNVIYIPSISKVLMGLNKYPKLESDQLFITEALVIDEDTVDIIGKIIEMKVVDNM